ncbi:tetratricopeptide repeat protein [Vibrio kasasachensis]|uniref:heme biosynthesis protein HemY n=1 Tax=Vibrio kasasachensis TaxID=2910248 RepID=UPI003D11F065
MFRLIFLFAILGAGLFVGSQYNGQQGYVLVSVADKTIEMSVTTLVIFIIAALAGLFGLEFIIKKIFYASSATWNYFSVRKMRRSRRYTNEGIIKLLEGDFKDAEKKVTRWANHHDMPLLCYLVASEAAQGLGDANKRDHYLKLATEQKDSRLAVELTRAKQQLRETNFNDAFATLSDLKGEYPNNPIVLNLLKSVYVELKLWELLLELLPKLIKAKLIDKEEQQQLELRAQCGLLAEIAENKGSEGLLQHWNSLPRKLKSDLHLVECFTKQLISRKADDQAFTIIKETLKKHPIADLYKLLPELNLTDNHPAIVFLEDALRKDANNAEAHSALAQFHLRTQKWSEAQQHLEKALAQRSNVSDYSYLADALEKQNFNKAAHEVSKKALTLINNQ